jgi:hypothetical protein
MVRFLRTGTGAAAITDNWDGSPLRLEQYDQAAMANTPNGSMIFAFQNLATENNNGTLMLGSGGQWTKCLPADPLQNAPTIFVHNWQADNLTVSNLSQGPNTPIQIQACGPGMPGQNVKTLPSNTPTTVQLNDVLKASLNGGPTNLVFLRNDGYLGVFGLIGGPLVSGNNAYMFAVNYPGSSTPPGYTATTTSNRYIYPINNWISDIYIFYFAAGKVIPPSWAVAGGAQVVLLPAG